MFNNLHLGAEVVGFNNQRLGKVKYLVANPQTSQITHLVVEEARDTGRDVVVEAGQVVGVAEDGRNLQLRLDADQLGQQPDFIERDYVNTNVPVTTGPDAPLPLESPMPVMGDTAGSQPAMLHPLPGSDLLNTAGGVAINPIADPIITGPGVGPVGAPYEERRNVPEDALVIKQGVRVDATDGKLGNIKDVNLDPATGRILSFVVEKGFLFTEDITIPLELVTEADEDRVVLIASKEEIKNYRPQSPAPGNYNQPAM